MKKFVIAATMIALFPVVAHSQQKDKGPLTARSEAERKRDKEIDEAYQKEMKRTGAKEQAAKNDPWKTVRPAGANGTKN